MNIAELESAIRDRINANRRRHALMSVPGGWNILCSALDVLGDTYLGLCAYLDHAPVLDDGTKYLHLYGALQLLQTQQDATKKIGRILGVGAQFPKSLNLIRTVRSLSVAHPTEHKDEGDVKSNFIVRMSVSQHSYTLMTVFSSDREWEQRTISVPQLVASQNRAIEGYLELAISTLDREDEKHKAMHRERKLAAIFPETLSYYVSKLFEDIHSEGEYPLGKMHLDLINSILTRFQEELERRGEWGVHDSVDYEYGLLAYPIAQLMSYFTEREHSRLNHQDAYIFASFVREKLDSLRQMAKELDKSYEESGSEGEG